MSDPSVISCAGATGAARLPGPSQETPLPLTQAPEPVDAVVSPAPARDVYDPDRPLTLQTVVRLPPALQQAHHALTGVHLAAEGIHMANVVAGSVVGGVVGQGLVGAGMTSLGVMQIVDGVREKSPLGVLEGTGTTLLGVRSGLVAAGEAGEAFGMPVLASVAHGAHGILEPLGIAHGSIEAVLGGKTLIDGIRSGKRDLQMAGAMGMGLGASVVAASLGAGLPAVLCGAAFLVGKIAYEQHHEAAHLMHLE